MTREGCVCEKLKAQFFSLSEDDDNDDHLYLCTQTDSKLTFVYLGMRR